MRPWILGGGLILAMLTLSARGAKARPMARSQRGVDLDALANMLITETRFSRNKDEMAQIVNVAVNRAQKYGKPISVVVSPGKPAGLVAWNSSDAYRKQFNAASGHSRWEAAREFASGVLDGSHRNIGATRFVHPGNPVFNLPCQKSAWAPQNVPGFGTRCIPKMVHGGRVVGGALFA